MQSLDDRLPQTLDNITRQTQVALINSKVKTHMSNTYLNSQESGESNSVINRRMSSSKKLQKSSLGGRSSLSLSQTGGGNKNTTRRYLASQQSSSSYIKQFSNQSSFRNNDNKFRHVQILKNILNQVKKQRRQKKKAKKLDKRKNTLLKRTAKINNSLTMKNSSFTVDNEESESSDDEEIDNIESRNQREMASKLLFMPDSQFKAVWDFIVLVFIFQQSIIVPIQICFETGDDLMSKTAQFIIDIIFMTDIILSFNSAVYDKGLLVSSRKQVVILYFKTWFVIDFFSSLPYDFIFDEITKSIDEGNIEHILQHDSFSHASSLLRLLRVLRFMRILKLLRVFKLQKIMMAVEEYIVSDEVMFILRFAKIMVTITFFAHWMACFFWFVGVQSMISSPTSWIISANLQDEDMIKQYVFSLYWAIQTMCTVGYGDISPRNANEQMFVLGAMLLAAGIYALTLNNVAKMIRKYNILAYSYREKMMYVNQFMNQKNLPKDLRIRVWRYLQYVWEIKKQIKIEEEEVFEMLNQDLRERITVCMNGFILQTIPFFENFEMEFTSELTFNLKKQTYSLDDNIFVEGEKTTSMYYILSGRIAVIHRQTLTYLDDLIKDDYFGEIAFFTDEERCATMKSRDFTDVYIIERDNFLELAEEYDEVIKFYHEIRHKIFTKKDYSLLKLECYICRKVGHRAIDCNSFKHKRGNLIFIYNKIKGRRPDYISSSIKRQQSKYHIKSFSSSPQAKVTRASRGSLILNASIKENQLPDPFSVFGKKSTQGRHKSVVVGAIEPISAGKPQSSQGNNSQSSKGYQPPKNFSTNNVIKLNQILSQDESYGNDPSIRDEQKRRISKGQTTNGAAINNSKLSSSTSAGFGGSINDQSLNQRKSSPLNQRQQKRDQRKSIMYEKLILKLRNDENMLGYDDIIKEEIEDSFQSSVSSVDEDDEKSNIDDITNDDQKQYKNENYKDRLALPFQNMGKNYEDNPFKKDNRKQTFLGDSLAIVPEESESMYSHNFMNPQHSNDSSSKFARNSAYNFEQSQNVQGLMSSRQRMNSLKSIGSVINPKQRRQQSNLSLMERQNLMISINYKDYLVGGSQGNLEQRSEQEFGKKDSKLQHYQTTVFQADGEDNKSNQ